MPLGTIGSISSFRTLQDMEPSISIPNLCQEIILSSPHWINIDYYLQPGESPKRIVFERRKTNKG